GRDQPLDLVADVAHLIILAIASDVDGLVVDGPAGGPGEGSEGAGDVAAVDQGPPGRAIGLDADLAIGQRRGQEGVDDQVDPQHGRVAVGGGVAEEGRGERVVGQLGDGVLGVDLGPGVGGQGIERVGLVEVELLALAVDGAAAGEEEAGYAGALGRSGQADG